MHKTEVETMKKVLAIVLCLMLSLSFTLTAFAAEEDPDAEAKAKRAANIEVVTRFYDEVFNAHDVSKLDEFMRDDYMQHNATVADGKQGFIEFTDFFFTLGLVMKSCLLAMRQASSISSIESSAFGYLRLSIIVPLKR